MVIIEADFNYKIVFGNGLMYIDRVKHTLKAYIREVWLAKRSGFVEEKLEQKLFTELRPLYTTSKESPYEIRIKIRMRDLIYLDVLRHAVDSTMERYPLGIRIYEIQFGQ